MKTKNIKMVIDYNTAKCTYQNRMSGSSTYLAIWDIKATPKQMEAIKKSMKKHSKTYTILNTKKKKTYETMRVEIKIGAGVGYSVWHWFWGYILGDLNKNRGHDINHSGIVC